MFGRHADEAFTPGVERAHSLFDKVLQLHLDRLLRGLNHFL